MGGGGGMEWRVSGDKGGGRRRLVSGGWGRNGEWRGVGIGWEGGVVEALNIPKG